MKEVLFPDTKDAQIDELLTLYPQNVTQGSPYDTGTQNALTPEFKRIASILGDFVFQAPRRFFLQSVSDRQNTWSFCTLHAPFSLYVFFFTHTFVDSHKVNKRLKSLPIIGSFHSSDLANIFGGEDLTDFLIQFVTTLDPNGILSPQWPRYRTSSPQLMTLLGSQVANNNRTITLDTYRAKGMEFITHLSLAQP